MDIFGFVPGVTAWLNTYIFTANAALQLIAVGLVFLFSILLARLDKSRLHPVLNGENIQLVLQRLGISRARIIFLLAASLLLWLVVAFSGLLHLPLNITSLASNLVLAWLLIRLGTGIIKTSFWSRIVAICIWIAAALVILGLMQPFLAMLNSVGFNAGAQRISLLLILKGGIIFLAVMWLGSLAVDVLGRILQKSQSITEAQKVMLVKVTHVFVFILAVLLSLNLAGLDMTMLAIFGGALGIGLGFGLQRIFANLIGGFILLMDKSIKPGDVISVMDTYGWVNKLSSRYVSILTRDGKEHLIPNEKIITEQVENWSYTDDKVRIHIPVTVSYDSDIHKVKEILLAEAGRNPRILASPQPVCLITEYTSNGIEYDVRVWIRDPVNGIANVRSSFYFTIWDKFKENGIEFARPQREVVIKSPASSPLRD